MLVQFGNNWIQKIPLTAKLDLACGLVQFWLSPEFFSSNYFQIGRHVVLLHTQMYRDLYGDAMLVPIRMGTNMAAGNQQKHLSLSLATKREFIPRGTLKHQNNTFPKT